MTELKISFKLETAQETKAEFLRAADRVTEQVTQRRVASEVMLQDFRGPYARTYEANVDVVRRDLSNFSAAFKQIADLLDMAIDAYQQQMRDLSNKGFWELSPEEKLEFIKDLFGISGTPTPPAILSPVQVPAIAPKNTGPTDKEDAPVVSAVPLLLREGIAKLRGYDQELEGLIAGLRGKLGTCSQECGWAQISDSGVLEVFSKWVKSNESEYIWLGRIADQLEASSGNPSQVSSLPVSALEAAIGPAVTRQPIAINNPTIQGSEAAAGYIGDPVNAATGNFIEPETDLAYTPTSGTLTFRRLYNATNPASGVFGTGWSSALDSHLILTDEKATWVKEDGQHIIFPRAGESWGRAHLHPFWLERLTPGVGALSRLEVPLDDRWDEFLVITDNTGAIWVFSPAGSYLAHQVGEGDGIRLVYNQDQQVSRIEHLRGRLIEIDYTTGGKVACVRGYDGSRIEYIYDETGEHLTQVISAAGVRSYTYNQAGLMDRVTAADGSLEVENTYDKQGRVCQQTYPHGVVRTYSYLANGVTLVRNADGSHANSWVSDEHGRLIGMIDAEQNRQSMAYDTFNNRVSVTERDGATTVRLFNNRGLITREVAPEGADVQWAYDEFDRVVSVVTAAGGLVAYEYADASGTSRNPSRITDPLGACTELTWEQGLLTQMVGPTGVSVSFAYDSFGELAAVTNAVGDSTVFERDAAGRVTALISPLGHRSSFSYDLAGNLISQQGPDGARASFVYGPGGRLLETIDPAGSSTCYEYGAGGDLVAVVDPLGRRVSRSFDQMGNLVSVTSASGASWAFDYDQLLNLVGISDPLGNRWVQEFDVTGQVTGVLDPTGVRQSIERNRVSGVQKVVDAFGSLSLSYDAYGRLIKESGPDGSEEVFTYDAAGRVVEVLDAEGGLTLIERDARGEITSVTSPLGRVTSFTYDAAGRLESMSEPSGVVTTLGYDADSRVISRVSSAGGFEYVTYDAVGRVTQVRSDRGLERFSYDACGRVKSVVDGRYGRRRFVYDAAGQLVRAVNGLGGVTVFEYSADGQLIRRVDPSGAVTLFAYDAAGRLVEKTDPLGRVTGFSYDAAGRLVKETTAGGDEFSYTYNQAGLLEKSWVNGQLQARLVRNIAARRLTIHDYTGFGGALVPEGPVVHGLVFDGVGRVVAYKRTASTNTKANSTASTGTGGTAKTGTASCGVNTSVTYSYSPDGDLTQLVVDGVATDYAYDAETGLLSSVMRQATGGQVLEGLTYHYDSATSALVEIRDAAGSLVRSFGSAVTVAPVQQQAGEQSAHSQVDALEQDSAHSQETAGQADTQSTSEASTGAGGYRLDGGWVQISTYAHPRTGEATEFRTYYNELGLVIGLEDSVDGLRLFSYDEAHQLIGVRSEAGFHSLTYSPEGFLTGEVLADGTVRSYSYDVAGQLVRLEDSGAGVFEFVYDALGRRVRVSSSSGGVREFVFGASGGVPGLILEHNNAGEAGAGESSEPGAGVAGGLAVWVDVLGQVAGVCSVPGCCAPVVPGASSSGSVSPATSPATPVTGSAPGSCSSATFLSWDITAPAPRLLGAGGVPVSLSAAVRGEVTGVRGVDPFGFSPVVASLGAGAAGAGSVGAGLSALPGLSVPGSSASVASGLPGSSALPGSLLGLTAAGSLALGGLEVLGARVYDAGVRGFLSVDPLAAPVGAGWAGNGYGFVGFSPVGLVDPWGLSPMSAAEFRKYHRANSADRAWKQAYKETEGFLNDNAWLVAGASLVAGAAILASGPVGWVGAAVVTGLFSFGSSVAVQKLFGGKVDLKKSLIDGAVGLVGGALGRLAGMGFSALSSSRVGSAMAQSSLGSQVGSAVGAVRSGVSSVLGSVSSGVSSAVSRLLPAGVQSGAFGGSFAPVMGSVSGTVGQWGRNVAGQYAGRGFVAGAVESSVTGAVNNVGGYWFGAENGFEPSVEGAVGAGVVGAGLGFLAPGISGGFTSKPGLPLVNQFTRERGVDFTLGGVNYLLTPSNDNKEKDPRKFVEEGFKNAVSGGGAAAGQRALKVSDEAIDGMLPAELRSVEFSRRGLLLGDVPDVDAGGVDVDQRRK